jgi:hypothetical protein
MAWNWIAGLVLHRYEIYIISRKRCREIVRARATKTVEINLVINQYQFASRVFLFLIPARLISPQESLELTRAYVQPRVLYVDSFR